MKILSSICARGGSKGIKNKNLLLLRNKPLIAYSIEPLKKWGKADRIICSTDSEEIQRISREYGAETPFKRPVELASDTASKLDVLKHLVNYCEIEEGVQYDSLIDLDPTSPLRTVKDIDTAFNMFIESDADLLLSAYKSHKNPYFNMLELDENNYAHICKKSNRKIVTRQQAPVVYSANASIYIYRRDFLMKTSNILDGKVIIYEMSDFAIDIDRELDFKFLEFILKEGLISFDY